MEMLLYLFASVGILYLMRGAVHWLLYRKSTWGLYVEVPLSCYDRRSFCELMGVLNLLRESVMGKRLLKGIVLRNAKGGPLSREEAAELARLYGLEVKRRLSRKSQRRFLNR